MCLSYTQPHQKRTAYVYLPLSKSPMGYNYVIGEYIALKFMGVFSDIKNNLSARFLTFEKKKKTFVLEIIKTEFEFFNHKM